MCGIAGFIGSQDKSILQKMTRTLVHRGPDDEGFFQSGPVNLGMRRLAVIDIAGGKQPMTSDDGKITLVFNGEIYNYKELIKTHFPDDKFLTNSDTEVILKGYQKWGTDIFNHLDGMFAAAIWDENKQSLILARDKFGEKPLYYSLAGNEIIFGSEIKSLLAHPAIKKEIDFSALSKYLAYDYVPAPLSIFKNIFKIPAGNFLVYKNDQHSLHNYWDMKFTENKNTDFKEAKKALAMNLEKSVGSRLLSDVPLGVFLSGGIDSSAIAYFAQKNSTRKIKTFSITFDDKSFDESYFSRLAAKHIGTDHSEYKVSTKEIQETIPQVFGQLDEPLADASILPSYILAKYTRQKVTVALAGDGSDELFGGYPTFQARKLLPLYDWLPKKLINPLISLLPTSFDNITWEYGLKRIALSHQYPDLYRDLMWIGSFAPHQQKNLLIKTDSLANSQDAQSYLSDIGTSDFNQRVKLYTKMYLQDDILTKSDRASMMNSLEVRAPFLAANLVEFINSLPVNYKMRGLTTKYLLKEVMKDYLPEDLVYRKKKGFGIPLARWLIGDLKPLVEDLILNREFIEKQGIFNYPYLVSLWSEHLAKKKDNRKQLWNLMTFQMWYKNFYANN